MSSKSAVIILLVVSNVVSSGGGRRAQLIKQSYPQSAASLIDRHMKAEQLIDYRLSPFKHTRGPMGNQLREISCLCVSVKKAWFSLLRYLLQFCVWYLFVVTFLFAILGCICQSVLGKVWLHSRGPLREGLKGRTAAWTPVWLSPSCFYQRNLLKTFSVGVSVLF